MRNYMYTYPNHNIWKMNLLTQEITPVFDYQKEPEKGVVSVEKEQMFWYCSALNKDAATRKFNARAKRAYKQLNPD